MGTCIRIMIRDTVAVSGHSPHALTGNLVNKTPEASASRTCSWACKSTSSPTSWLNMGYPNHKLSRILSPMMGCKPSSE